MSRQASRLHTFIAPLFSVMMLCAAGCDGDDGDSSSGGDTADSNSSGGTSAGTSAGTSGGPDCDQTDPNGAACNDADNCNVACDCGDGLVVTIGTCVGGSCDTSPSECSSACTDSGGTYTNNYCFVGTTGGTTGGTTTTTTDGGDCTPVGGACSFSSDCCSSTCNFDDICE